MTREDIFKHRVKYKSRLHTYFNPGQASTLGAIAELKGGFKNNPGYIWLH